MPELNKEHSWKKSLLQLAMILAGLLLMYLVSSGHNH